MLVDLKNKLTEIDSDSPEYPSAWQELPDKPEKLYALGDISLLRERKLAIVGSRRTPANALKLGTEIAKTLSEGFVVLTGTADGGDTAAIEGALLGSGRVICLLAGGFSALPQFNRTLLERVLKRGLIISPHPFETEVRAFSYEYRNKLLAKLCSGVLVIGAGEKSGALITAKYAAAYKKPVFAFPYPPNSASGAGCNALIKKGGYLTESALDIAEKYGVDLTEKKREYTLTADEERVYEALKEGEAHASELAQKAGVPVFKLRAVLSSLEVKGLVVSLGGNCYAAV
nr:DNA-protecting protein DprA [Clostridia bacterium]